MEFILWAVIFIVFFAVFKALSFEKVNKVYYEKELIKRYFEIKNINSDYRVKHLKEWEVQAKSTVENIETSTENNVIYLGSSRLTK